MYTSAFKRYEEIPEEELHKVCFECAERIDSETVKSLEEFDGLEETATVEQITEKTKIALANWDASSEGSLLCKYDGENLIQITAIKDVFCYNEIENKQDKYYLLAYIINGKNNSNSRSWFYDMQMLKDRKEFLLSYEYKGLVTALIDNTVNGNHLEWLKTLIPEIYSSINVIETFPAKSGNMTTRYRLPY